ncbi:hypothetical protein [Rothia nasimurium]|uniref:hypothetical protein n=1 Tax=Rothia nasimurium TaxID=85336 RepID=UPI003B9FDE23
MINLKASRSRFAALALVAAATLSACGNNSTETTAESTPAPTWAGATAPADVQLEDFRDYEKVEDVEKAVADLKDQDIITYYNVMCAGHVFPTKEEILNFTVRADFTTDVEAAYKFVNDAPDIVRQISDRNLELRQSTDANRPSTTTDSRCLDSAIIKKAKAAQEKRSAASTETSTATSSPKPTASSNK